MMREYSHRNVKLELVRDARLSLHLRMARRTHRRAKVLGLVIAVAAVALLGWLVAR